MLRTTLLLFLALPALLLGAESCGRPDDGPENTVTVQQERTMRPVAGSSDRGTLISAHIIETRTRQEIASSLRSSGIPEAPSSGAAIYKIVYRTLDSRGQPTTASGALAIPDDHGRPLPMLSYQHGTVLNKRSVASVYGFDLPTLALAGSGYVVAAPDYVGMGDSPGMHPYVHAASLAGAVVDLLRALRAFCAEQGVPLAGQLFLMGYSEGGYATMAAAREIEEHHADELKLTASAPMAGPYDMSGAMYRLFMSDRSYGSPYYLPYVMLSYDDAYDLYGSLGEVFRPQYVGTIQALFEQGGSYGSGQPLPSVPRAMLTDDFVRAFQSDPQHPLRVALRENDLTGWRPSAPMRLYHGTADEQVPYENSTTALAEFRRRGATQVELVTIPGAGHGSGAVPSLIGAKRWFDSLSTAARTRQSATRSLPRDYTRPGM